MKEYQGWKSVFCICALTLILLLASCSTSEKTLQRDLDTINGSIDAFQALPAGLIKTVSTVGQTKTEAILHFTRTEMGIDYEKLVMHSVPRPPEVPPVQQGEKREKGVFYRMDFDAQEWVKEEGHERSELPPEVLAMKFEDISQVSHIHQVKGQDGYREYLLTPTSEYVRNLMKHMPDNVFNKSGITMEITYEIDGGGVIHRVISETFMKMISEEGETKEEILRLEIQYEKR